jgi:hypothetical protein
MFPLVFFLSVAGSVDAVISPFRCQYDLSVQKDVGLMVLRSSPPMKYMSISYSGLDIETSPFLKSEDFLQSDSYLIS